MVGCTIPRPLGTRATRNDLVERRSQVLTRYNTHKSRHVLCARISEVLSRAHPPCHIQVLCALESRLPRPAALDRASRVEKANRAAQRSHLLGPEFALGI